MANNIKLKAAEMRILGELFDTLEEKEKDLKRVYKVTGEKRQSKNWRTGELEWEDEEKTIPKMEAIWDYFDKEDDEYSAQDKIDLEAIKRVKDKLEKLA